MYFISFAGTLFILVQLGVGAVWFLATYVVVAALLRFILFARRVAPLEAELATLLEAHRAQYGDGSIRKFFGEAGPLAAAVVAKIGWGFAGDVASEAIKWASDQAATIGMSAAEGQSRDQIRSIAENIEGHSTRRWGCSIGVAGAACALYCLVQAGRLPLGSAATPATSPAPAAEAVGNVEAPPVAPDPCGGDAPCVEFFKLLEKIRASNLALQYRVEAGTLTKTDLQEAEASLALGKRLRALACKKGFVLKGACEDATALLSAVRRDRDLIRTYVRRHR